MSGRPLRIEVLGQPIEVLWNAALKDTGDVARVSVNNQRMVLLEAGLAEHQARDTVLHELLHTILKMTGHDESLGRKREEQIVSAIAPALLLLLRANPHLVSWLTEEIR